MKRYFSPQGAKRGLILAAIAAFMWSCWALGYVSGVNEAKASALIWILK
jgi:hypothetical protein